MIYTNTKKLGFETERFIHRQERYYIIVFRKETLALLIIHVEMKVRLFELFNRFADSDSDKIDV